MATGCRKRHLAERPINALVGAGSLWVEPQAAQDYVPELPARQNQASSDSRKGNSPPSRKVRLLSPKRRGADRYRSAKRGDNAEIQIWCHQDTQEADNGEKAAVTLPESHKANANSPQLGSRSGAPKARSLDSFANGGEALQPIQTKAKNNKAWR